MNVKRAFGRRNKRTKFSTVSPSDDWIDTQISKARYILGFSEEVESSRNGSTSSASTSKLRSVTFSEATTAPVQTVNTIDEVKAQQLLQTLQFKIPLVPLYNTEEPESQRKLSEASLQPRSSSTSLRSYYDKSQTPLNISQQTSDSSSRDFALRKGVPSILTDSAKETEHLKQLRLASKSEKRSSRESRPDSESTVQDDDNTLSARLIQDLGNDLSNRTASVPSKESLARISVVRGTVPVDTKRVVPLRHTLNHEHRLCSASTKIDLGQAKLNVRRPKAGTKNWFDDVDSESDEEVEADAEPQLEADFALRDGTAFKRGNFDIVPPRTSSRLSKAFDLQTTQRQVKTEHSASNKSTVDSPGGEGRRGNRSSNRFADVDLQEQSVLYLSSSEEEDEDENEEEVAPSSFDHTLLSRRQDTKSKDTRRNSVEDSRATSLSIRLPDVTLNHALKRPPIPERSSGRLLTQLQDQSAENLPRHDDLLTSFPRTPIDTLSRQTSFRSIDSESDSQRGTKLINLTKQEKDLIAALRSKRVAMLKAQALAHRQDALRILELDSNCDKTFETQTENQILPLSPISPLRMSYASKRTPSASNGRTYECANEGKLEIAFTSVPSNRSSMLTYMTDTSQDLQPSSAAPRKIAYQPSLSQRDRRKFLSATTVSSTTSQSTQAKYENPFNTWDYHDSSVGELDRQPFREDIPSQLFMERPYLGWQGWEGQSEMQMAH